MAFTDTSIRVAAAAFALGLALAGPQAAGVAAADRGDTDANLSAAADDRGGARGGPEASASDEDGAVTSAPTDEPMGTDENTSAEGRGPGTEDPIADPLPGSNDQPVPDDLVDDLVGEPIEEDPGTGEPVDLVDPEAPAEEPDPGTENPAEDPTADTLPGSDDQPAPDDLVDDVIDEPIEEDPGTGEPVDLVDPEAPEKPVTDDTKERPMDPDTGDTYEPVVSPSRGGPHPLPWWRTTALTEGDEGAENLLSEPEPMPDAQPVDHPAWLYSVSADNSPIGPPGGPTVAPPKLSPTNTAAVGNQANQAIDSLVVQISAVIDQVAEWLNSLPANPITELVSGALLLLRRALAPETPTRTDDPGNSISDPEPETEIPSGLVGLTEDEAVEAAAGAGWTTRIVSRDGEDFMITKDYLMTRVNFSVVSGVVTAVYVG